MTAVLNPVAWDRSGLKPGLDSLAAISLFSRNSVSLW